jgi:hypothetical protein
MKTFGSKNPCLQAGFFGFSKAFLKIKKKLIDRA